MALRVWVSWLHATVVAGVLIISVPAVVQFAAAQRWPEPALPATQRCPRPEQPFVFFHPRKSGGTDIRWRIFAGAQDGTSGCFPASIERPAVGGEADAVATLSVSPHNHDVSIEPASAIPAVPHVVSPCHTHSCNVHEDSLDAIPLSKLSHVSVVSAHLKWGRHCRLLAAQQCGGSACDDDGERKENPHRRESSLSTRGCLEAVEAGDGSQPTTLNMSCLTIIREPVDRVISCYYYRCAHVLLRFLQDMAAT